MQIHRVALIGVGSRIGPAILDALVAHPSATYIVVFLRPTSRPPPLHPRVHTVVIPSDPPTLADLTTALKKHDIESLVCALNASERETGKRLAEACVASGVTRFVPADYGSMRSDDPYVLKVLPNFRNKKIVREYCQELAEKHPQFSWTSLATGHFFDYGLHSELLGIDAENNTALLFDGGDDYWSTSTTQQIGRAVAAILFEKEAETKNKMLLIQSFCVTQRQVVHAMEAIKGRGKIKGTFVESKAYIKEKVEEADKGSAEAVEELVAVLGIKRSNWTGDELFSNELLGLKPENLQEVVARTLGRE